jgi:rSAM/selenodomain-associated transferase 1
MQPLANSVDNRVLGIFAKRPVPGQVKTRLAAETSPDWASEVARAFLLDTLERMSSIAGRRVLAFAPVDAEAYFAEIVQERYELVSQGDGDLGQRMASFFARQQENGATATVLIGTDSPTLPVAYIEQAFVDLRSADVVLGPATDGGYYLIGCGKRLPPIFTGIRWSSDRVLAETVAKLTEPDWKLAVLPPWYDVDTLTDWRMLQGHLAALRKAGMVESLHLSTIGEEKRQSGALS